MILLIDVCAKILNCNVKELRDRLNHPSDRERVLKEIRGKKVQTTYKDRNGFTKTFFAGGLSLRGAAEIEAFGRLSRPFNISVCAYFYARHKIRLHHPYLHCIIEHSNVNIEKRYYPLELLELDTENESHEIHGEKFPNFGPLFQEINKDKDPKTWKPMNLYAVEHVYKNEKEEKDEDEKREEDDVMKETGRSECSQYDWGFDRNTRAMCTCKTCRDV